jgi:hypothetical protein
MNSKLSKTLTITAFIFLSASNRPAFTQTSTPSASPTPAMQMQEMNQMPGMDKMSDSVTKMSEMCMAMMEKEKAMMPLVIGTSAIFGLLLFVALLLLVVLEIQWIKYWSRILKQSQSASP